MKQPIIYPNLEFEKMKNGDTIEKLSKVVKCSIPTTYRRLKGQSDWTISDIEALCEYYKKTYDYLFKRGKEEKNGISN